MPLINEHFTGISAGRLQQLEDLTSVTFNIVLPPNDGAIPTPYMNTEQLPVFETFDSIPDRDALLIALNKGPTLVKFTTAQGEEREMLCTMNEALIPASERTKTNPASLQEIAFAPNPSVVAKYTKAPDPNLIKVYALDRAGWRSFRFERLHSFKPT